MNTILSKIPSPYQKTIMFFGALVAVSLCFVPVISGLSARWSRQEEYGYAFFIPAIVAWMLWQRRDAIEKTPLLGPHAFGIAGLCVAAFLLYVGLTTDGEVFQQVGLVVALISTPFLLGGTALGRISVVPLFFLFFMIPLPYFLEATLTARLQDSSSQLGVFFIRLMDIPVYRLGNIIDLGDIQLFVDEACAGLRYLFPIISISAICGYMLNGPLWFRLFILVASVPITIFMNGVRLASAAYFSKVFGTEYLEGFSHFFEGWVVFVMCLLLLLTLATLVETIRKRRLAIPDLNFPEVNQTTPSAKSRDVGVFAQVSAGLACLLLLSAWTGAMSQQGSNLPLRQPLLGLYAGFENWQLVRTHQLSRETEDVLGADDYVIADYTDNRSHIVNLYVAYLEAQRDGRSWHSPEQCIPGGGWAITQNQRDEMVLADGSRFPVNRMVIQRGDFRQLVYYWYDQRGRRIASETSMKLFVMADAYMKGRTDGSMVRVMTPLGTKEDMAEADNRVRRMIESLVEVLPTYVPA